MSIRHDSLSFPASQWTFSLRSNHHIWLARIEQHLFGQDEIAAVVVGHGKLMAEHDRLGRAGFFAVATEDAAQQVHLVDRGIALARRRGMRRVVLRRLHVDRAGGASRLTQHAADAALHAVLVAAQFVLAAEARIERRRVARVFGRNRLLAERLERHPHRLADLGCTLEKVTYGHADSSLTDYSVLCSLDHIGQI